MQAIEFKTILHNGTFTMPPQYSPAWEGKNIRVIVLTEDEPESSIEPADASESLFSRLSQIQIFAPADFAENIDAYLNQENNA
jgi:hypothetical protein